MHHKDILTCALLLALAVTSLPQRALAGDNDSRSASQFIFPPDSVPFGMTYGDWSAAWWQYALSIPASTNPIFDETGALCGIAQGGGPVFFLNPSGAPGSLITRTCTVPARHALWVPLTINECSTIEPPPSNGSTPQELRTCSGTIADGISIRSLKLTVDHVRVRDLESFRTVSPFFDFTVPTDNIFGVNNVTGGSSVSDGYFVMLKPLSPGNHVIHHEGAFVTGPAAGLSFSVTYNLTVQ